MRRQTSPRVFMLAATLAACGASTDLDERPPARPCTGEPSGVSLHLARTSEGAAFHWDVRGGCIATTYDPSLADTVGEIRAALDAWRNPCSDLCFSAPVASSTPPATEERRVHFSRTFPPGLRASPGAFSATILTQDNVVGRIRNAQIVILPDVPAEQTRSLLVRGVGQALGFAAPASGTDSALSLNAGLGALTAGDAASLCAFYGRPPWCERP